MARLTTVKQIDISSAQVGLIGVGNMGEALLVALLKAGADPQKINFAVRRAERSSELAARYQITPASIEEMASKSDVLMLIVKPQDLETIMERVAPTLQPDALVISFLAGKKIATIEGGLGNPVTTKLLNVALLDASGQPLRAWSFDNAFPVKWEFEPFQSGKNEVALEKVELSYLFLKREV